MEAPSQVDGREQKQTRIEALGLEKLSRCSAAFGVIGLGEVPPALVGGDLGEELGARGETL